MTIRPRVSIGLPVFNGERFLPEAIQSILDQSLEELELIISDNASTDLTEEICREYQAKDDRIVYVRNRENYGAAYNYNQTFHLSSAEYFKWMAHDDVCLPHLLSSCVEALDQDPGVVLGYTMPTPIDELGQPLHHEYAPWDVFAEAADLRFRSALHMHSRACYPIWGVFRAEALSRSRLQRPYPHGDHALLVELSLYGRFQEVSGSLLLHRHHSGRSIFITGAQDRLSWWSPAWSRERHNGPLSAARFALLPYVRILGGHLDSIKRAPVAAGEKRRCRAELARWTTLKLWTKVRRGVGNLSGS